MTNQSGPKKLTMFEFFRNKRIPRVAEKVFLGASDFFLVNVREERAADAQIRATRAILNGRLAQTSYNAATMNMDALGL